MARLLWHKFRALLSWVDLAGSRNLLFLWVLRAGGGVYFTAVILFLYSFGFIKQDLKMCISVCTCTHM